MVFKNGHRKPSVANRNTGEYTEETQFSPVRRDNDGGGLDAPVEMMPNESVMSQIDLLPGCEWYSLSFAEAGVERFSGLEPFTLSQQGWRTFS